MSSQNPDPAPSAGRGQTSVTPRQPSPGARSRRGWVLAVMAVVAVAVVTAVVVIAVSGGDETDGAARPGAVERAGLTAVTWHLTEARDGADQPVPVIDAPTLTFQGGTLSGSDGCNRLGGTVDVDGDHLVFGRLVSTMMACPDRPAGFDRMVGLIHSVLGGRVGFTVAGQRLTLTKPGSGTLVYTRVPGQR